jgi:hypothetical protein
MGLKKFTVFCRESNNTGTTWIDSVRAKDVEDAKVKAVKKCAKDWGYDEEDHEGNPEEDITCIGVAKGNVVILDWDDLC